MTKNENARQVNEAKPDAFGANENPTPDKICIYISMNLCELSMKPTDPLLAGIVSLRENLANETGLVLPIVNIRDFLSRPGEAEKPAKPDGSYAICFGGCEYGSGTVNDGASLHAKAQDIISLLKELVIKNPDAAGLQPVNAV
jgi:flagellar biosynthesis component FlhA